MKVLFVSKITPFGHLSTFLMNGLKKNKNFYFLVDKDSEKNEALNFNNIYPILTPDLTYIIKIIFYALKIKPKVIHIQHEINMFGGFLTAIFFPFLILILRLFLFKVVVTIHSAIPIKEINKNFSKLFFSIIPIALIKLFFIFLFKFICFFSNHLIVHTILTKNILVHEYKVNKKKISVIRLPIINRTFYLDKSIKPDAFLYYGYFSRRKGLFDLLLGYKKFIDETKNPPKLIMAGGVIKGQEKAFEEIKEYINKLSLNKYVYLHGYVKTYYDLDLLFSRSIASLIPAIISMGSSGPLAISRSYGKISIASSVGHLVEDIDKDINGFLVKNNEWFFFFKKVHKEPSLIKKMEINLNNLLITRSPDIQAKKTINLFNRLFK